MTAILRSSRIDHSVVRLPKQKIQETTEPLYESEPDLQSRETVVDAASESTTGSVRDVNLNRDDGDWGDFTDPFNTNTETPLPAAALSEEEKRTILSEETEQAREQGHKEGYAAGSIEGKKEARAEFKEAQEQLRALLASFTEKSETMIEKNEDVMVEIVFASLCKVLGESAAKRNIAKNIILQSLGEYKNNGHILLHVSPHDYDLLNKTLKSKASSKQPSKIELVLDDRVELGGCIIETEQGSLDARLETQINILKDTLLKIRERRKGK